MIRHPLPAASLALVSALALAVAAGPGAAQTAAPPAPSPAPGAAAPADPGNGGPGNGDPGKGATPARPTLVDKTGEPGDVDEVVLPAKPAAILAGKTKWEEAVPSLKRAFAAIEADLARLGVAPAGRPLAVFTRTDDDGFEYEAMVPVAAAPAAGAPEPDGLRFGTTPAGKALRFMHRGSYESIDGTYETLTAYLDAKDVVVQDRFVEEYATDLKDGTDDALDVNIYALLK